MNLPPASQIVPRKIRNPPGQRLSFCDPKYGVALWVLGRRRSSLPRIKPFYLVADDFGRHGRAWRETDLEAADLETIIQNLLSGEYRNPIRVVGFNTAEGWCRDVSALLSSCAAAAIFSRASYRKASGSLSSTMTGRGIMRDDRSTE